MNAECRSSFLCYPMIDTTMEILPRKAFSNNDDDRKYIHKSHLQDRNNQAKTIWRPTEYMEQYIKYNVEKAHSIPQLSHFKMKGDFSGVPEYNDSFKMYANYSKSAPIKKTDNLRMSGSEYVNLSDYHDYGPVVPEYQDKFCKPLPAQGNIIKEKSVKQVDHLKPGGSFSKDNTEYLESFGDPQLTHMPERGKCREPFLRLKGKLEFNPEYRNNYLNFPRARPIVQKPTSTLRLPVSHNSTSLINSKSKTQTHENTFSIKNSPEQVVYNNAEITSNITNTPEYRRANYHYQIREHKSPHRSNENIKAQDIIDGLSQTKSRNPRSQSRFGEKTSVATQTRFDNSTPKKYAKYGRRASVSVNAKNRDKYGVIEANPKYLVQNESKRKDFNDASFLVLDDVTKRKYHLKN